MGQERVLPHLLRDGLVGDAQEPVYHVNHTVHRAYVGLQGGGVHSPPLHGQLALDRFIVEPNSVKCPRSSDGEGLKLKKQFM